MIKSIDTAEIRNLKKYRVLDFFVRTVPVPSQALQEVDDSEALEVDLEALSEATHTSAEMKNRTIELKERWCMRNDEH
jgi:hypothetical protein